MVSHKTNNLLLASFIVFAFLCISINGQFRPSPRRGEVTPKPYQIFRVPVGASFYEKWREPIQKNLQTLLDFTQKFKEKTIRSRSANTLFLDYLKQVKQNPNFSQRMLKEMEVISEISGIPFDDVVLINFVYEIYSHTKACTSIVVRNAYGEIFHGRNLDYTFKQEYSDLSIQIDFYDPEDPATLVYSTSPLSYAIVHTGIRYGAYAVSLNQREVGGIDLSIKALIQGALADEYLIDEVLRTKDTYASALKSLKEGQIIASCYYIVSGIEKNEGALIERDRDGVYKMYELSDEKWFIVATNYDQDKQDFDTRRTEAIAKVEKLGPKMSIQDLYDDVMTQYPNFHYSTISTTMMSAQDHYLNQTKWY